MQSHRILSLRKQKLKKYIVSVSFQVLVNTGWKQIQLCEIETEDPKSWACLPNSKYCLGYFFMQTVSEIFNDKYWLTGEKKDQLKGIILHAF